MDIELSINDSIKGFYALKSLNEVFVFLRVRHKVSELVPKEFNLVDVNSIQLIHL